ncbi:MAG: ADP-ribosylation factor-like protein [Candidatus Helarchaeota archaeon]
MDEHQKKVLFIGLDNAGKTSFIRALDRKKVTEMKPTLGIDLTYADVLGYKISRWDCGGQINYRQSYFKDEANVFSDAALVFFILDILETDARLEEALKYFEEVIEVYKLIGEKPAFIICLHKFDPDVFFEKSEDLKRIEAKAKELEEEFKNISEGFNVQITKTSIFDRETLIRAFSIGIKAFLTKYDLLDLHLTEFAEEAKVDKVVLYEKNSLIIGESKTTRDLLNPLNTAMMEFIVILDELSKKKKPILKLEISVDDQYSFVIFSRNFENFNFYLGLLGDKNLNFSLIIELFEKKFNSKISAIIKDLTS